MRLLLAVGLLLALGLPACRSRAPERVLYQWADAEGNVRFTSSPGRVPRAARATLTRVEPGRSADDNAALLPGARTQPRPETSAAQWLRGEEAEAAAARRVTPPTPEELPQLDARIRELETQITEAEVELADRTGAPEGAAPDAAAVREVAERLPRLQAELAALRERRALAAPADER
jgi:hypothetical protein